MLTWSGITLGVVVLGVVTTVLLSWRRPELGAVDGRLHSCPDTPNCVCSHADDEQHGVDPLLVKGGQDPMERLKQVMADVPGATLIDEDDGYLRYECATLLLRYVDDVEFLLDPQAGVIHVRSASRVGRSDLGANRRRVEEIWQRYDAVK